MSKRAFPLGSHPGPKRHLRDWLTPGYAWWRIRSTTKYLALRTQCAIRGHDDAQHFRDIFANGDDLLHDEKPWCSNCGTEAT